MRQGEGVAQVTLAPTSDEPSPQTLEDRSALTDAWTRELSRELGMPEMGVVV